MKFGSASLGVLNAALAVPMDLQRVYTGQGSPGAAAGFDISGTFVGTLVWEATIDDVRWFPIAAHQSGFSGLPGPITLSTTVPGVWTVNGHGYSQVRVRMANYTSGSATVATALTASQTDLLILRELMITNKLLSQILNQDADQDDAWRADAGFGT